MVKDNFVRVKHMVDAVQVIHSFIQDKQREDLDNDLMLFSALIRQLEVIGEAAARMSQYFKENYPDIPWQKIVGMRNRLIHAYFDVDPDIVWQAVTVEIPKVASELEKILSLEDVEQSFREDC